MNRIEEQKGTRGETQHVGAPLDKSRRTFAKTGVIAPVLMTLTSKTALGSVYQCTISGVQSGNVSNHSEDMSVCKTGKSPTDWLANVDTTTAPNYVQWIAAGVCPVRVEKKTSGTLYYKKGASGSCITASTTTATAMCNAILGVSTFTGGSGSNGQCAGGSYIYKNASTFASIFDPTNLADTSTFWDALSGSGLKRDACVAYLNASAGFIQDVSPAEVVKLYRLCAFHEAFYDGSIAVTNEAGAAELLANLHQ
ncbi:MULTISPECIES: hypothetical protein [Methylomonas]|uniref:Uncharacterized protein n=2 Tax=Methylomonas TaxID=416 RepID=A0A177LXY7_METMH|nr:MULTISPECIES: hypothetical protein [Methylomonas]MCQ8117674.1 hypothetical protein [Methylomonas sp. WSC-7]OAH98376.1 hypothetical protein A1332_20500 [Methylomonas methanica]